MTYVYVTHFRYDYFRLRLSLVSTCLHPNSSTDAIVNVTAVEFRFGAVVLTEKLVFDKTFEKIGVAESHLSTHLFVCSSCHRMKSN